MEELLNLAKLLPKYEQIQYLLQNEGEAAFILQLALKNIKEIQENTEVMTEPEAEEANYLLQALTDKFWERIHTGKFSEVSLKVRKIYALAKYFKVFYLLFESLAQQQVENCSEALDDAMLLGYTRELYEGSETLQQELMKFCNTFQEDKSDCYKLITVEALERQTKRCDIEQINYPTVETFREKCFECQAPALLLNTIQHWPALKKWRDLNYILKVAGNRTVPVEIGLNYTDEEWSQRLMKVRDFLQRQFSAQRDALNTPVEYLAQHELFDQVPELKADICIPEYCSLSKESASDIDIKAWLGPKGTISPMHNDPKHNLLCQVFGMKSIILAAPNETSNLYTHESQLLNTTSQIDAAHLDFEKFPLTANVKFYELSLQPGDCLYIPPKWWHYVRAESESFSVSFWWE